MTREMPPEMTETSTDPALSDLRPSLVRIAYRMLGSVADSEVVVQEASLRWLATPREVVREPAAFLRKIVTRLCLNELKSVRRQPSRLIRYAVIDGLPGFVTIEAGGVLQTTALHIEDRRIVVIYVTRNPDKLRHLPENGVH